MSSRTSDIMGSSQAGFVASPATGADMSPRIVPALVPVTITGRPDLTTLAASLNSFAADLDTPDLVVLLENRLL